MNQSMTAGLLLILFGLIAGGRPSLLWQIGEKWKSAEAKGPSAVFLLVCRILGAVFVVVGALLAAGVIQ